MRDVVRVICCFLLCLSFFRSLDMDLRVLQILFIFIRRLDLAATIACCSHIALVSMRMIII